MSRVSFPISSPQPYPTFSAITISRPPVIIQKVSAMALLGQQVAKLPLIYTITPP